MLAGDAAWPIFNAVMVVRALRSLRNCVNFPTPRQPSTGSSRTSTSSFPSPFMLMSVRVEPTSSGSCCAVGRLAGGAGVRRRPDVSAAASSSASFGVLMLMGAPITVALGAAAMAALYSLDQNLVTLVQIAFTSVNSYQLDGPARSSCWPGALHADAGLSRRLIALTESVVGPIPGGLAVSTASAPPAPGPHFRLGPRPPRQRWGCS
ncbi:MAG: hypothetical protein V8Q84_10845 [Bilophila sp.]